MKRRSAGLVVLLVASAVAQTPNLSAPAPAKNYSVSLFSDQGYHSMHVRGASADLSDRGNIKVTDLTLTLYSGDETRRVETVILSPEAVVQPEQQVVFGPDLVRLIQDDLELIGRDWTYDHGAKKILIRQRARIVFNAELGDLLK